MTTEDFPDRTVWTARYHVPRSQVWEGSRGGAAGKVHLHVPAAPGGRLLVQVASPCRAINRRPGATLCGKKRGWYERPPNGGEELCPRCVDMAERYGVRWPQETRTDA